MIQLIVTIIFAVSLLGVVFILFRKIEALSALPRNGSTGIREHHIISGIEKKFKGVTLFFEKQILLQKFLSLAKRVILKTEVLLDNLLHSLRKKAQKIDKDKK